MIGDKHNDERSTVEVWLSNKEKMIPPCASASNRCMQSTLERNIPSLCLCPAVRTYTL